MEGESQTSIPRERENSLEARAANQERCILRGYVDLLRRHQNGYAATQKASWTHPGRQIRSR